MPDQGKIQLFKELVASVTQTVTCSTLCRCLIHAQVIKLTAHGSQPFAYLSHRIATAQYTEQHCEKVCSGLE